MSIYMFGMGQSANTGHVIAVVHAGNVPLSPGSVGAMLYSLNFSEDNGCVSVMIYPLASIGNVTCNLCRVEVVASSGWSDLFD